MFFLQRNWMKFERYKIGNFVIGLAFATIGSIYFATPLAAADCERLIDCLDKPLRSKCLLLWSSKDFSLG